MVKWHPNQRQSKADGVEAYVIEIQLGFFKEFPVKPRSEFAMGAYRWAQAFSLAQA